MTPEQIKTARLVGSQYYAQRNEIPLHDREDFVQEVLLNLYRRLPSYDSQKMGWFSWCQYYAVLTYSELVYRSNRLVRKIHWDVAEDPTESFASKVEDQSALDRYDRILDMEEASQFVADLRPMLTEMEDAVLQVALHLEQDHFPREDISQILGIHDKGVDNAAYRIRAKARTLTKDRPAYAASYSWAQ